MRIPKLHYISQGQSPEEHLKNIQSACSAGAELVQFRIKNESYDTVLKAAKEARQITSHFHTRLIINDFFDIAKEAKADGVHLGLQDDSPTLAKKELYSWQMVGGTANTLQDCLYRIEQGVDYIGLGPFRHTKTKENLSPLLGIDGYLNILNELQTKLPIIAIGGLTLHDVPNLLDTGIYGVATSSEITKNFNTISKFQKLLRNDTISPEQVWVPH